MSDNKSMDVVNSELLYAVVETIENGKVCVTVAPEIWIIGHVLYWPPGIVNIRHPTPPESDWVPHMCKVLRGSIATLEEALDVETMYSNHRNSDSFREELARKKLKRLHPVNENERIKSSLIDANSMVSKIKSSVGQGKHSKKNVNFEVDVGQQTNKYHNQCYEKHETKFLSETSTKNCNIEGSVKQQAGSRIKKGINPFKPEYQSSRKALVIENLSKPITRYPNYLKSGNKTVEKKFPKQNENPPSAKKKASVNATLTKNQYLAMNGITDAEYDKSIGVVSADSSKSDQLPINENGVVSLQDLVEERSQGCEIETTGNVCHSQAVYSDDFGFDNPTSANEYLNANEFNEDVNTNFGRPATTIRVLENVLIKAATNPAATKPAPTSNDGNFQSTVMSYLHDIKKICMQSDTKRLHFEARMQTQWEVFAKKMTLAQGRASVAGDDEDDFDSFEDLDENFAIDYEPHVTELEWNIQKDLTMKRRLLKRLAELGGKSANEALRIRMKYLITDSVLDGYTWRGTGEKKAFEKLTFLNDLIYKSVQAQFKKYTYKEYQTYMVQWLKHSGTRQRTVIYVYPNRNPPAISDNDEENYD